VPDVAQTLAEGLGSSIGAEIVHKFRAGDIRPCSADASHIERELGFQMTRAAGFRDLIHWSRAQTATDLVDRATEELRQRGSCSEVRAWREARRK
jgi:UDP-glucose 4-epimerase